MTNSEVTEYKTAEAAIQAGIDHHQNGRLQDAELHYRAILKSNPRHPDANHNLGVLAMNVGKPQEALPFFRIALEEKPETAQFWISMIGALIRADFREDAKKILEQGRSFDLKGKAVDELAAELGMPQLEEAPIETAVKKAETAGSEKAPSKPAGKKKNKSNRKGR